MTTTVSAVLVVSGLAVELRQGASTLIAARTIQPTVVPADYSFALTLGEEALITDRTQLRVRLTANGLEQEVVTQVYLEGVYTPVKIFTISAVLRQTVIQVTTTSAVLSATLAPIVTGTAVLLRTELLQVGSSAQLAGAQQPQVTVDSVLLRLGIATTSSVAAVLQASGSPTVTSSAVLRATEAVTVLSSAILQAQSALSVQASGWLQRTDTRTVVGSAVLQRVLGLPVSSDAVLVPSLTGLYVSASAHVSYPGPVTPIWPWLTIAQPEVRPRLSVHFVSLR